MINNPPGRNLEDFVEGAAYSAGGKSKYFAVIWLA